MPVIYDITTFPAHKNRTHRNGNVDGEMSEMILLPRHMIGRAHYHSVTKAPHPTEFYEWMGKKHFCFFQTAGIGKRNPNSTVKGSGASHYPKAFSHNLTKFMDAQRRMHCSNFVTQGMGCASCMCDWGMNYLALLQFWPILPYFKSDRLISKTQTYWGYRAYAIYSIGSNVNVITVSEWRGSLCSEEFYNGRCYIFIKDKMTWNDANITCTQEYDNIVSIPDKATEEFITNHTQEDQWLGIRTLMFDDWTWVTSQTKGELWSIIIMNVE